MEECAYPETKDAIIHIYGQTEKEETCKDWGEVSDLLYLFSSDRKWTSADVNKFMIQMWNYLEFNK